MINEKNSSILNDEKENYFTRNSKQKEKKDTKEELEPKIETLKDNIKKEKKLTVQTITTNNQNLEEKKNGIKEL